jgi:hypothetical protein
VRVSIPRYPSPGPYDGSAAQGPWEQPGIIPLRPMTVGDILSAGFAVLRRHLVPLGGAAVLVAAISTCVTFGTLAAAGSLRTYADGLWLQDILSGKTSTLPGGILLSTVLGLLVTTTGAPVIAGMASAYTGAQALGHDGRGAVTERLRGRWGVLLGVAAVVGVSVTAGLMLLIVPGVIAYLILVLAAPAAVMERGSVGGSLRRSSVLTRGHRGRILGAVAVAMILGAIASAIAAFIAGSLVGQASTGTALLVTEFVSALVGGLAAAWTGAVVAVLYVDVRIRTEHLDQALRSAAAAHRARVNPPTQPGY